MEMACEMLMLVMAAIFGADLAIVSLMVTLLTFTRNNEKQEDETEEADEASQ